MKLDREFNFVIFGLNLYISFWRISSMNDQFGQNILNYRLCYQGTEFIGVH